VLHVHPSFLQNIAATPPDEEHNVRIPYAVGSHFVLVGFPFWSGTRKLSVSVEALAVTGRGGAEGSEM
jgi:hypothetical protein